CIATPPMPGIGCPSYLASEGLGSHVSTCDGAPCAKMWMTLLALPTRGGRRGAKGDKDPAAWASAGDIISGINAARLNAPNPMPDRCRNCRRVRKKSSILGVWSARYCLLSLIRLYRFSQLDIRR